MSANPKCNTCGAETELLHIRESRDGLFITKTYICLVCKHTQAVSFRVEGYVDRYGVPIHTTADALRPEAKAH